MFSISTNTNRVVQWKLGEAKPELSSDEQLKVLMATDTAYSYIITNMKGIPKATFQSKSIWKQPFAQFIFDNLEM